MKSRSRLLRQRVFPGVKRQRTSFGRLSRSELMARVRSHGNKNTELRLIQVFRDAGITGWRRGSKLVGKPDFVFQKLKAAVFVDGCFWHGCPEHGSSPKTRASFWLAKITGNKARDRRVNRILKIQGWNVLRIWEHELRQRSEPRLLRRLNHLIPLIAILPMKPEKRRMWRKS